MTRHRERPDGIISRGKGWDDAMLSAHQYRTIREQREAYNFSLSVRPKTLATVSTGTLEQSYRIPQWVNKCWRGHR